MGELRRSRDNKMLAGVFGGISDKYGWDVSLIRVFFVIITLLSAGVGGIVIYIAAVLIIPEDNGDSNGGN